MKVIRYCKIMGTTNTMEIPITFGELEKGGKRMKDGEFIQNVFPQLNADQREFLLTGLTPEQWDSIMPPEDDPDGDDGLPGEIYDLR